MWVIELDDGSEPKALFPSRSYTVGRGMGSDFLLTKPSISKNHLEIRLGHPTLDEVNLCPTPLVIYTESKATTEVNGVMYKASPEKPKTIEVSDFEVTLRLGSLKREHSTLRISWDSFVMNFEDELLYASTCTAATRIDARPRRYREGELHGGFVSGVDKIWFGEVHALIEGVPVMSSEKWMECNVDEVRKCYRNRHKLALFEGETVCTEFNEGVVVLESAGADVRPLRDAKDGNIVLKDTESVAKLVEAIRAGNLEPLRYHEPKATAETIEPPKWSSQRKRRKVTLDDTLSLMFGGGADDVQIPSSLPEAQVPETVEEEMPQATELPQATERAVNSDEKIMSSEDAVDSIDTAPKKKHNMAEAIILSKQIKRETQNMESLESDSPEVPVSVDVEPANLLRKEPPPPPVSAPSGRKNFKRFRKTGTRECDGSRVFLNLVQYQVSANSIRKEDEEFLRGFADSFNQVIPELDGVMEPQRSLHSKRSTAAPRTVSKRVRTDQLFVSDADFEAPKPQAAADDEEDATPKFRFSRR